MTRGAVQSIPREQHEAAAALGFGWVGRHAFVIMPQALRRLLPPLVGLLVNIIQNTTIVQVIGAPELSRPRSARSSGSRSRATSTRSRSTAQDGRLLRPLVPPDAPRRVPRAPADVGSSISTDKPEITEIVNAQMPLGATLGIQMFGDADEVDATTDWAPEPAPPPVLHGGVLMSLADAAGGVCAFLNLPAGAAGTATIESKTNFLGVVRGNRDRTARPLHIGKTTIVVETDVFDAADRRVARTIHRQSWQPLGRRYPVRGAVAVAQLVEPRPVVPVVAGSSPVRHP